MLELCKNCFTLDESTVHGPTLTTLGTASPDLPHRYLDNRHPGSPQSAVWHTLASPQECRLHASGEYLEWTVLHHPLQWSCCPGFAHGRLQASLQDSSRCYCQWISVRIVSCDWMPSWSPCWTMRRLGRCPPDSWPCLDPSAPCYTRAPRSEGDRLLNSGERKRLAPCKLELKKRAQSDDCRVTWLAWKASLNNRFYIRAK